MTAEQVAALRAFVVARAKAYIDGSASYDATTFTAADAAAHIGADQLATYYALMDLDKEDLVRWYRPGDTHGYWIPMMKAAREP